MRHKEMAAGAGGHGGQEGDPKKNIPSYPSSATNVHCDAFLSWLRPGGPWILTAIVPDGTTVTETFTILEDVDAFVERHNGTRNIYYTHNPTKTAMSTKPSKDDIAAAEFAQADLDPRDDETPEEAKARILKAIEASSLPPPSAIIGSGNGIQLLWRLKEPLTPATAIEPINKAILKEFGGKGT